MQTWIISQPHFIISNQPFIQFLWFSVIWIFHLSEHPLVPACWDNW